MPIRKLQPATGNPQPRTETHIAIIGAGLSGLNAARRLAAQGYRITLLEAQDHIGGRVLDIRQGRTLEPMGPEFIHGKLPLTLDLLKQYKIKTREQDGEFVTAKAGHLVDEEEDEGRRDSRHFDKMLEDLKEDLALDAFLGRFLKAHPTEVAMAAQARSYACGYFAADPKDFSTFSLREDWLDEHPEGRPRIDYEPQLRPVGGYSALVDAIVKGLEGNVEWRLSCPVTAIEWTKGEATVAFQNSQKKEETLTCQAVVLAVPAGVLQRKSGTGAIRFSPDIPSKRKAAKAIGTGPVLKVRLNFDRPFWQEMEGLREMGFLLSTKPPIEAFWTDAPRKTATLTAWSGGPTAKPFAKADEEQVLNACLDSLSDATGVVLEHIWDLLKSYTVSYWGSDPYMPEAYSYQKAGQWAAPEELAKPLKNTLFFAGEASVRARYGGTVEAALEAGQRTAEDLIASMS